MKNPFNTPFAAIFWNEVLLNTKRVAPYALMVLFSANAVLWWGWGPAVARAWATNSDFYISRNLMGFSFVLGLPIFTAVIMGDPVIRDIRLGVSPLIFSKPVGRASYLLGKFFGNFFMLVCCQAAFPVTTFLLQWVPFSGMVVLPWRVFPYFKHFFFIVVITHLVLAAFYFTIGTLTRNIKIVYGLAACFYPALIVFELALKALPIPFRVLLDPIGFNTHTQLDAWRQSADFLNQYVVSYSLSAYANRVSMIVISAVFLLILYFRFAVAEQTKGSTDSTVLSILPEELTVLSLSQSEEKVGYNFESAPSYQVAEERDLIKLPKVTTTRGPAATLAKIIAALDVEFRLLRAERSLVVLGPLVIFLSTLDVALYRGVPEVSYSVLHARDTAGALLLFLTGLIVFYTGEAMHRDRELRIEPVAWAKPAPNSVWLLSKFLTTFLLMLCLIVTVGLAAIVIQFVRGNTPINLSAYFLTYAVILVPSVIFVTALVVVLNVVLRNKYVVYVFAIGTAAGLLYAYNIGYNHRLYNPLLYKLWKYADLTQNAILLHRLYFLAIASACLALAHLFFRRKSTKKLSFLIAVVSIAASVMTGLLIK